MRHTTFRYRLDPTVEQLASLGRHAGASRFAYNQCLQIVNSAIGAGRADGRKTRAPWSGFDLINAFNAWKKSDDAGRVFAVDSIGQVVIQTTGLVWRDDVCQQVFEEAAIDCGRALAAWSESRPGKRRGKRIGFPRFKSKGRTVPSFRMRNRHSTSGRASIRVGDDHARAVNLPRIRAIRVHDDTRPLGDYWEEVQRRFSMRRSAIELGIGGSLLMWLHRPSTLQFVIPLGRRVTKKAGSAWI